MRAILLGLGFGFAWAAIQYFRGEISRPAELAAPVLLCGAFGLLLWAVRALLVRFRSR